MKKVIIISLFVLFGGFMNAHAVEQGVAASSTEEIRGAFLHVLTISVDEIKSLSTGVGNLKHFSQEEEAFKNEALSSASSFLAVINALADQAKNEKDAEILKKKAQEFKEWREGFYLPWVRRTSDFIILSRGEIALAIAKTRLQKIAFDLEQLKNQGLATDAVQELLKRAQLLIIEAEDFQKQASDIFWNQGVLILNKPTVKDVVGKALDDLKSAYRVFFEMGNLVRKLLK